MKRIALLAILAFTSLIAYSKYVIVNVEIPGTLDYEVAKQADWKTVDSLKVIGGMELMSEHTGEWEEAESRLLLVEVENITIIYIMRLQALMLVIQQKVN